ncbi:unnamed protein product, partial [Didymodactylos carnosus]
MKVSNNLFIVLLTAIHVLSFSKANRYCTKSCEFTVSFDSNSFSIPSTNCSTQTLFDIGCYSRAAINFKTRLVTIVYDTDPIPQNEEFDSKVDQFININFATEEFIVTRIYLCTIYDDCARKYTESIVQTLIDNKPILNGITLALYNSAPSTDLSCYDQQNNTVTCSSGTCKLEIDIIGDDNPYIQTLCSNQSPRFSSIILRHYPPISSIQLNELEYYCNVFQCNSFAAARNIQSIIETYLGLTPTVICTKSCEYTVSFDDPITIPTSNCPTEQLSAFACNTILIIDFNKRLVTI